MLFDRPSPADLALNDYWNALNAGAPADELERLAAKMDQRELAALHRVRAAERRYAPDPAFVRRLEDLLMTSSTITLQDAAWSGRTKDSPPAINVLFPRHSRAGSARTQTQSRLRSALAVAVVVALALGILATIRFTSDDSTPNRVIQFASPAPVSLPDVPVLGGNAARTGEMPGPGVESPASHLWTYENSGPLVSSPALVDGVLYLGGGTAGVLAIDAISGELIWATQLDAPVDTSPAIADGLVFVASNAGTLTALDATDGEVRWNAPGARIGATPVVVDGVLVVEGEEPVVRAYDPASGDELWSTPLSQRSHSSGASANGTIYIPDGTHIRAISLVDGASRWEWSYGRANGWAWEPIIAGDVLVVSGVGDEANPLQGFLAAVDPKIGVVKWRFFGDDYSRAVVSGDRVWFTNSAGEIVSVSLVDGSTIWSQPAAVGPWSHLSLADGALYIGDKSGRIVVVNASDGTPMWSFDLGGGVTHAPIVSGGIAFITTSNGVLHAIAGDGTTYNAPLRDPDALQSGP